jgi:hypothetical protein
MHGNVDLLSTHHATQQISLEATEGRGGLMSSSSAAEKVRGFIIST